MLHLKIKDCVIDWRVCVCVCVRSGDVPVWGLVQPPPGPAESPQQGHQERWQDRAQLISFYSDCHRDRDDLHWRCGCIFGSKPREWSNKVIIVALTAFEWNWKTSHAWKSLNVAALQVFYNSKLNLLKSLGFKPLLGPNTTFEDIVRALFSDVFKGKY